MFIYPIHYLIRMIIIIQHIQIVNFQTNYHYLMLIIFNNQIL